MRESQKRRKGACPEKESNMDAYKNLRDNGLETPENIIVSPEVRTIPMVALRGKVILPSVATSFDVGRIKSLAAINAAVDTDEALIFVSAQRDAKVEEPAEQDVCSIGTVCRIRHITRMPGDNIKVNVNALFAAEIISYHENENYFLVTVKERIAADADDAETEAYFRVVKTELANFLKSPEVKVNKDVFANILALDKAEDFVNAASYNMNFKEGDKQQILELANIKDKLYAFFNLLVHEIEIIKTEKEISDKVKASVEKSQREYYLRERLKAIHSELGDDEDEAE